jgi:hypothetical protein
MKIFIQILSLAAALALALPAGSARAQDNTSPAPAAAPGGSSVSFQSFYNQLASQGTWIQSNQYGYVFQPTENDPNWRPYTYGHWVNTDAGMTWVSDDAFGWATDHYGRWVNLDGTGWVWVPGYTWAPAWVSWRDGDDEVGWAPLPPDSGVGIDYFGDNDFGDFGLDFGFHIGDDCDVAYGIGPGCYNFCPIAYIGDRDCWRHFRDRGDNFALIGRTRNVTDINYHRGGAGRFGHVREQGPSVAALNARARTPIQTARLTSATDRGEAGLHGNTLAMYAPRVDRNTVHSARPDAVTGHLANATVNRGTDINRPLAVNSRVRPATASPEQIHAAAVAQRGVPANARIATSSTRIAYPLTQPLTSMRTSTRTATVANGTRFNHPETQMTRATGSTAAAESRYTGEPATDRASVNDGAESRYTGEPAARSGRTASAESRYTGEAAAVEPRANAEAFAPVRTEPAVHHTSMYAEGEGDRSVYHTSSSSIYHSQAGASVFHTSTPIYHSQASAPAFHSSAQAYHPQASFHPSASHFGGGGGFHGGAPAAHAGGGGGGHPGGGGGAHASAGSNGGRH